MTVSLLLIAALLAAALGASAGQERRPSLADRFLDPPAGSRMLRIVHGWPAEPAEQDKAVERLREQGFGGAVTNLAWYSGYTEDAAAWPVLRSVLGRMHGAGLDAWLYDEAGYPSGRAGTLVLRDHPELEATGLFVAQKRVGGGPVSLDVPPGKLVRACALPVRKGVADLGAAVDLSGSVRDGKLTWQAPSGDWLVLAMTAGRLYDGTQVAVSGAPEHTSYVNLLDPRTTQAFLAVTHDRYARELGPDLGRLFRSTFTDEPSLLSIFFSGMPYAVLPWADNLPAEFARRRGYPLAPVLPALVADAGARGARVRCDFWLTVAEVFRSSFFEPIQRWCSAHKIPSGGHLLLEEDILHHVTLYGDMMRCFRAMDVTGIDCLSSDPTVPRYKGTAGMGADVPWNAARLAASAAELEGKPWVMCEVSDFLQQLARPPAPVTEERFRGTYNRLLLGGVTRFNTYSSFSHLPDEQVRRLNLWVGRCCEMLTGGTRQANVAVLYPIETAWSRFTPSSLWVEQASPEAKLVEQTVRETADVLFQSRREFSYIDTRTLLEGRVKDGALAWRGSRWRVVVLPCVDTLPAAAWDRLLELKRAGGTVVAIGARPANTPVEFPSAHARRVGQALLGGKGGVYLPAGDEAKLAGAIDAALPVELGVADSRGPIRMTHRRIEGHEVYFVVNDGAAPWEGSVTPRAAGAGQLWDPATGRRSPVLAGGAKLSLGPWGAAILRYRSAPTRR